MNGNTKPDYGAEAARPPADLSPPQMKLRYEKILKSR